MQWRAHLVNSRCLSDSHYHQVNEGTGLDVLSMARTTEPPMSFELQTRVRRLPLLEMDVDNGYNTRNPDKCSQKQDMKVKTTLQMRRDISEDHI